MAGKCTTVLAFFLVTFLSADVRSARLSVRVVASCTTTDDCIDDEEYCHTDSTCQKIQYSSYPYTSGVAISGTAAFDIVMATDAQFYLKTCKQEPLDECIFNNAGTGPGVRNGLLQDAVTKQTKCIEARINDAKTDVKAVFNNGDITNNGVQSELDDFLTYFHDPVAAFLKPMIVGLGNHDYGNIIALPDARKRMLNFFASTIDDLTSSGFALRNMDYMRSAVISANTRDERYNQGSFSYSFEINGYVFIMLHWSTGLPTGVYTDYFSSPDVAGYEEYFDVTSPEEWLRRELVSAEADKKPAILVPHSWAGLEKFVRTSNFEDEIESSSVIAMLCGHDHDHWGFFKDATFNSRTVPVYYAGSASYQKIISVAFQANRAGLSVTAYDTSTGASCAPTADDSTRMVARAYDELRVELTTRDSELSLCDVKVHYADDKELAPTLIRQSSTENDLHAGKAFENGKVECSQTRVGNTHYWTARFRPGHCVSRVVLEGNEKLPQGLMGAKVIWNDRHVNTIATAANVHSISVLS